MSLTFDRVYDVIECFCYNLHVMTCIIYLGFRDEEIAAKCEGQCEDQYVDCTLSCSDTNCLIDCGRELTACVDGKNSIFHQK